MRKLFTFIFGLLSSFAAISQTNISLAPLGAPNYLDVNEMVKIGNNIYIAAEGGLFVSTNNGTNWNRISSINDISGTTSVSGIYQSGNYLMAESDGKLFRSSDNGLTWEDKTPGFLMSDIYDSNPVGSTIIAISSDTAFMSFKYRFYISNNGGDTWVPGATFSQNWDYGFVNNQAYVSTTDTFQMSSNGLTFNNIALTGLPSGSAGISLTDLTSDGTNIYGSAEGQFGARVFRTPAANPGTWTSINNGLPIVSIGLYIQPLGNSLLCFSFGTNFSISMYRSTNQGTNWSSYSPTGLNNGVILNALELNTQGQYLAISIYEVMKSTDNGATWTSSASSTPTYNSPKGEKPLEFNGGVNIDHLFGSLRSTDGGLTFSNASTGIPTRLSFDFGSFGSKNFFKSGGNIHFFLSGFTNNTLYSSSNGTSWQARANRPGNNSTFYIRAASDAHMIAEGNDTTFFTSSNGGSSWTDITTAAKAIGLGNFATYKSDPNGTAIAVVIPNMMAAPQVSFSNNGGVSWTSTNTAATALFDFSNLAVVDNNLFLLSSNFSSQEVWHWSVASQNWNRITATPSGLPAFPMFNDFQAAVVNNTLILAAVTDSALYYSADSGRTFTKVNAGLPSWVTLKGVAIYPSGNIYLTTQNYGIVKGSITTGLRSRRSEISFNIFPNPSNGVVKLSVSNNASVTVTDIQGRLMATDLKPESGNGITLDVSHWTPGVYLCRVKEGNAISTQKLIVSQ